MKLANVYCHNLTQFLGDGIKTSDIYMFGRRKIERKISERTHRCFIFEKLIKENSRKILLHLIRCLKK